MKLNYKKLLDKYGNPVHEATLLGVLTVNLDALDPVLIDYDTDYGVYQLPKEGIYLMLMFLKPSPMDNLGKDLFITLRRHTMPKQKYYMDNIGKVFDVVLTEDKR